MAGQFISPEGDLEQLFVDDYEIIDQFVGIGTLWSFGRNQVGQLGTGTASPGISSPVQTVGFGTNWKQVSVGGSHTAAIKADGTLWLWGINASGSLGDNTTTNKSSPVQTITFATNWKQVSASSGGTHTAAIKTDGTLWCWGFNSSGQLGDNSVTARSSPVQTVAFGSNWKQVSVGGSHTTAIKVDGTLWCWGLNSNGQLGDNTVANKSSPVQTVAFGTNWKLVSGGNIHTAAIKTDGTLWCWGSNVSGQLGDNIILNKSSPVQTVAFGTNWKQVSTGALHTAAIKTDGTLWCWGSNSEGSLGDNTTINRSSPVQTVAFGTNWKQVSTGGSSSLAVKSDGTLWSWGSNAYGQLGDNSITPKSSPVQTVAYGTNWKQVSTGGNHSAATYFNSDGSNFPSVGS